MKNIFLFIAFILFHCHITSAQESLLDKKISISISEMSLESAIQLIGKQENILFTYSTQIVSLEKNVQGNFQNTPLSAILTKLFAHSGADFFEMNNHILILKKKKPIKQEYKIRASITGKGNKLPVPYAGVQILGTFTGTMADENGYFELKCKEEHIDDTLIISAIGYQSAFLVLQTSVFENKLNIEVKEQPIVFDPIPVPGNKMEHLILGNDKKLAFRSLYIDTHGQQAALLMENKDSISGKIASVSFFVTKNGNSSAPLRIRLYKKNNEEKPGESLMKDVFIVKPNIDNGWYTVDLLKYGIIAPKEGFFVGVEGVYPADYSDSDEKREQDNIHYGQKIGCSKQRNPKTFHYSLSRTWFQPASVNLELMIKVDIVYDKE